MRAAAGGLGRFVSRRAWVLLARNTVVSCLVFAFDLVLLWLLVQRTGIAALPAAGLAFIVANALHYMFGRTWIFRGTDRGVAAGFAFFLVNAAIGLVLTMLLYAAFLEFTSINYLVSRTIVSVLAGLTVFYLNAALNFRSI